MVTQYPLDREKQDMLPQFMLRTASGEYIPLEGNRVGFIGSDGTKFYLNQGYSSGERGFGQILDPDNPRDDFKGRSRSGLLVAKSREIPDIDWTFFIKKPSKVVRIVKASSIDSIFVE